MSDIEFGNNLTEGTGVKSEKERTQYGALEDSERENYRLRETITYFNFLFTVSKVRFDPQQNSTI